MKPAFVNRLVFFTGMGLAMIPFCGTYAHGAIQPPNQPVEASQSPPNRSLAEQQYKEQLLEFVPDAYLRPTNATMLKIGLESQGDLGQEIEKARDRATISTYSTYTTNVQMEQQSRLLDQVLRLQEMKRQGGRAPGLRPLTTAVADSGKITNLQIKTELLKAKQEELQERMRISRETRKLRAEARLADVMSQEVKLVSSKSGASQNVILSSIKGDIMRGQLSLNDPIFVENLDKLELPQEDFSKIRLMLDDEGKPVVFSATVGSSDVGRHPSIMNHPRVLPLLEDVQRQLKELSGVEDGTEFYLATVKLSQAIEELEERCDEVVGTGPENAKLGQQEYRKWKSVNDYLQRLRGLLFRLELEGTPAILKSPRGKYDPQVNGKGILPFVFFLVENGCSFAPAAAGDEATYIRLQQKLLYLKALLEL